jgi:hypothetical protein
MGNCVTIIEDTWPEMVSELFESMNRSHWRVPGVKWSVSVVLLVLLAIFGLVWPTLINFDILQPFRFLAATTAYLVLWIIAAAYVNYRSRWNNFIIIAFIPFPCLLIWPTMGLLLMYCHCLIL